ncbi:hypothetical protein MMC13_007116 [Lambiella insularis]|nr:hypothetical protein [Lambiella insularis]
MTVSVPLQPRSPSPPPPTAFTPGILASRLTELYATALQSTLRTCSYNNFAACFPTPAAHKPELLRSLWQQVVGKIEEKGREEFEGILGEREVVEGLNRLEAVLEAGRGRRDRAAAEGKGAENEGTGVGVAPHLLPPLDLYHAHLSPQLVPIQASLEDKLQSTRSRNEKLVMLIQKQREEVERLVGGLEAVVKDLEGANEVLGDVVGSVKTELVEI